MELNESQKKIVTTTDSKVLVLSCAAVGKTRVLTERVRYLLNANVPAKEIVVITFTNAAADELQERLGYPKGLFVGTVHSYANYLLRAHGINTSKILDEEKFNKLFGEVKRHPECITHVTHLLLDEAQDSTPEQFKFIFHHVNPDNWMLVGDWRQSVYRWAGADPQYLIDLSFYPGVKTYQLNENYRNGRAILRYAKETLTGAGANYRDTSIAMRDFDGEVREVAYSPSGLARGIATIGEPGDWFVIARTNSEVEEMCVALSHANVPYTTFKKGDLTSEELNKKMATNTVKVLTIHTSKGLEAKNVAVIGARAFSLEEKCISYVAATRARDLLVWTKKSRRAAPKVTSWE